MCVSMSLALTSCFPRLLISEVESCAVQGAGGAPEDGMVDMALSGTGDGRYGFVLKAGHRELSGMLVSRTLSPGTVRVVGATYFGMTLFDMTLSADSSTMNYVAEPLSGKAFQSFLAMKLRKSLQL